jgi:hypothetical protein
MRSTDGWFSVSTGKSTPNEHRCGDRRVLTGDARDQRVHDAAPGAGSYGERDGGVLVLPATFGRARAETLRRLG